MRLSFEPAPAVAFNQANDQMKNFEGDRRVPRAEPVSRASRWSTGLTADAKEVKVDRSATASNAVVREISGDAVKDRNKAGINTVQWDLRHEPLAPLRNQPAPQGGGGGGGGFGGGGNNGPFVLPGTYRATVSVDGREANVVERRGHRRSRHRNHRRRSKDLARHGSRAAPDAAQRQRRGRSGRRGLDAVPGDRAAGERTDTAAGAEDAARGGS